MFAQNRFASRIPAMESSKPATTLAATYVVAGSHSPSSSIFAVSHPKLEKVVYPPKNPTAMAMRQSAEIIRRLRVNCPISPSKKHPLAQIPGVHNAPESPPHQRPQSRSAANLSPICRPGETKKLLAPSGSQESSAPAHALERLRRTPSP